MDLTSLRASKSKTGKRHPYYHCNPRKGCNERFKVGDAHNAFDEFLSQFKISDEVCDLFELILEDRYNESETSKRSLLRKVKGEINDLEKRTEVLLNKLIGGVIVDDSYKLMKQKYSNSLVNLNAERLVLLEDQNDIREFVKFGLFMLKNMDHLFEIASVNIKQKILSSILDEKLVFENQKYRTPVLKEAMNFIYNGIKGLEENQKKGEAIFRKLPA